MTEREFIVWLKGHMMEANYALKFNYEILDKLLQIKSETPVSRQLLTVVSNYNPFTVNSTNTSTTYDSFENRNQLKLEL